MSCLNDTWVFIASFKNQTNLWKHIPQSVKLELFASMSLAPLSVMDLRLPYDPIVSASDASESGGGVSFTSGLIPLLESTRLPSL